MAKATKRKMRNGERASFFGLVSGALADEVEEELVHAQVGAEFGMEGGGQEMAFADEDREAVAAGEGFDVGSCVRDARGADEDHLEWAAWEFCWLGEDGGVDLAAVSVALDGDVEGGERFLRGVFYIFCEEDRSGAGAEGWSGCDEGLEGVEEASTLEEFKERGGFAAGDDEAVEICKLSWCADESGRDTE